MLLRCPRCARTAPIDADTCPAGHLLRRVGGILRLAGDDRLEAMDRHEADVRCFRAHQGLRAARRDHETLLGPTGGDPEWRQRSFELRLLRALLRRRPAPPRTAIDVGSFDGWLSRRLAADGLDVTAVELFRDAVDGLGAFADARLRRIQADPHRPDLLPGPFDLVVINHGLHYLPTPHEVVAGWRRSVAPGGLLVVLGLRCWLDVRPRRRRLAALEAEAAALGVALFPLGGPGLLDRADLSALASSGLRLLPSPAAALGNLRAMLQPGRPLELVGIAGPTEESDR